MATTVTLPPSLHARLAAVQRRIRLLRTVRGLSLLVLLLGLSGAVALLADYWLDLPTLARQVVFVLWIGGGVVLLLPGVVRPLARRIDHRVLAAAIEQKYPNLGERLTSAVELAEASGEGHGSPVLIARLMEEAEERSMRLDFRRMVSARRAGISAGLAAVVVLLLAAPAFVWPQQYADLTQRFLVPWRGAAYHSEVTPGDAIRVKAVAPVELAAESPQIIVTPPAYARAARDEETFHGLVDLSPLQHSSLRFDFRFTRPAVAAYLEWIADNKSGKVVGHPLTLSEDRQAASFTMPAETDGKYRVVLEAEHGLRTVLPGGTIGVRPDQPPTVAKFTGKEDVRSVLPYERIPLEIEATDDIAVAGVELEYRVNEGETVRVPLTRQGGPTSVVARHVLELAGKVKEDDRFHYRFRVRDNLPKEYGGPHIILYPADRWLTLQIARRGDPLQQQEILARRDEIHRKLEAIKESLLQEKRGVYKVQQETRYQPALSPDQAERLQALRQDNQRSQKALSDLAETARATPALESIAEMARDVAEREMCQSEQALEQVPQQPSARERRQQFQKADEQLASALNRLKELKKANDKLAEKRLTQAKLGTLADREKQLAEQAAQLAAEHPVLDTAAREQAEKVRRQQEEVAAELEKLTQRSEPLRQALGQARGEQARLLAEQARELAESQRDLIEAQAETERHPRARQEKAAQDNPAGELARQQAEVAQQAAELARNIGQQQGEESPVARHARQARDTAKKAARQLEAGGLTQAREVGRQTAQQLRQLTSQLARKKPGDESPTHDGLRQAEQLGQRQEQINRRLQPLADDARAQAAQQKVQQKDLQQKADELVQELDRAAQQTSKSSLAQSSLQRAADAARQAQEAMRQAYDLAREGHRDQERQAQERAAKSLDRAAHEARRAVDPTASAEADSKPHPQGDRPNAGRAIEQARQEMARARGQLNQAGPGRAQTAMRQAAQSLREAAQQMAAGSPQRGQADQPGQSRPTAGLGRPPGGVLDLSAYGLDKTPYAGKSWGELPGDLRTKIVQDMKARYGDDYARAIKLYFEQIANTKKP